VRTAGTEPGRRPHGAGCASGPALAAAVARLAADPGLRAEQGRAARQKVLTRDWTAVGDALIRHYEAVLQPEHARRRVAA
jgi:phosphatidylinositol alpha 1,6-mannosyltransferase